MIDTLKQVTKKFNVVLRPGRKYYQIRGSGRRNLAVFLKELGAKVGVEIGTEGGKYARVLCEEIPGLKLHCIDPYYVYDKGRGYKNLSQSKMDKYFRDALKRLAPYNVRFITTFSSEAINLFEDNSLDFVYIDGNHRLDFVTWDIVNWTEKVKPGGIVAGHDYIKLKDQKYMHITYALDAYFGAYDVDYLFVLDNKNKTKRNEEENKKYDRIRSWFFIRK